jgi:hypothetical protein
MVESSLLRLSALFSTSLDPSNEMSDSVGCLRLSYLQLVYLLVCSIAKSLTERDRIVPINAHIRLHSTKSQVASASDK